ncbi:hypothetical protein [Synechococcus sp. NOUM97013]|uniref:hypothetical protein n=1 Tax=Synechococcus sp. NOUM97013 TaxID=1442555 RepID=UPI0016483804|nr:hypothetical protein [Synechococcus sp. NOUM97013]
MQEQTMKGMFLQDLSLLKGEARSSAAAEESAKRQTQCNEILSHAEAVSSKPPPPTTFLLRMSCTKAKTMLYCK